MYKLLILVFTLIFLSSCDDEEKSVFNQNGITQGIIKYDLSYPYLDSNDIGLNMLPETMEMTFRNNKYKIESVGGMGFFVGGYISDNTKKEMDYYLKIISTKYVSRFNEKGIKKLHKDFPPYKLEKLDSTRVVAGYTCHGYRVVFYSNVINDYNIWFTTDINLPGVNWCSPFPKVEGVLMSYQVQRSGLVINFEAASVKSDSIPAETFKIPLNYKVVPNKMIMRKMEESFGTFEY